MFAALPGQKPTELNELEKAANPLEEDSSLVPAHVTLYVSKQWLYTKFNIEYHRIIILSESAAWPIGVVAHSLGT